MDPKPKTRAGVQELSVTMNLTKALKNSGQDASKLHPKAVQCVDDGVDVGYATSTR